MINLRESLRLTTIVRATRVLPRADRKKMLILAVVQTLLGLLDLVGVVLLGLLGAISVGGFSLEIQALNSVQFSRAFIFQIFHFNPKLQFWDFLLPVCSYSEL